MTLSPISSCTALTEVQSSLGGRILAQPAGRVLGGSSATNLGMVVFPSKAGFDAWEKLGNRNWGFDAVSPYLRKFHTFNPPCKQVQELSIHYFDPAS